MAMHTFAVGDRVALTRDVERFPDFIAPKGATGTVVMAERDGALAVRMDQAITGAEEWDNEIHWHDDYVADIAKTSPRPSRQRPRSPATAR